MFINAATIDLTLPLHYGRPRPPSCLFPKSGKRNIHFHTTATAGIIILPNLLSRKTTNFDGGDFPTSRLYDCRTPRNPPNKTSHRKRLLVANTKNRRTRLHQRMCNLPKHKTKNDTAETTITSHHTRKLPDAVRNHRPGLHYETPKVQ